MSIVYRDFSMQFQHWNEKCICVKYMAENGGWIHFEQGPSRLCSIFFGKANAEDLEKAVEALNKCIPAKMMDQTLADLEAASRNPNDA